MSNNQNKMPKGIPYIVGNEAAERFSFYGMKAILTVFMTEHLVNSSGELAVMSNTEAQFWYHTFVTAVYFLPLAGALLTDLFWGKYRTIIILSVVYCLGHLALAMDETRIGLLLGLTMISIGSGGIKPAVSAHVGDQFNKSNGHLLEKVFGYFYFSINFGSFFSFMITPLLLQNYGPQIAFGVPGGLMILATIIFWVGRKEYTSVPANGQEFLKELKSPLMRGVLLKMLVMNLFLAFFWSLYDQNGSSWVNQARSPLMSKEISFLGWKFELLPSQVGAINPILVMVFIPLFTYVVYPFFTKRLKVTQMGKVSVGFFIACVSFFLMTWVQYQLDAGISMSIGWQLLAFTIITIAEVMIYQTCLELSYTQAPKTMKSLVMSFLMLSIAFGNIITTGVNYFILKEDGTSKLEGGEYFLFFSCLMLVSALLFIPYAKHYKEEVILQE